MAQRFGETTVNFTHFFFVDHSLPIGLVPQVKEAQACWYYVQLAHKSLNEVDEGATYEGELDPVDSITNILLAICMQYQIHDPDDVLKHIVACRMEAARCHYAWDSRVEKPRRDRLVQKVRMN